MDASAKKDAKADADVPDSFLCPLTQEVMREPVVDPEGNTYERSAIEAWLEKNNTSPITRKTLRREELVPNRALRDVIAEHYKSKGLAPPQPLPVAKRAEAPALGDVSVKINARAVGNNELEVLVSVVPPAGNKRTPCDICCVVDVSGSMDSEAKLKNEQGGVESHGLSLLDVVKHSVKTVVTAMHPEDRIAVVAYSDAAKVVFTLAKMDAPNKDKVLKAVDALVAGGSTNLWDGLHKGLELLRPEATPGRLSSLLLLTDGLPNISPPRGEVPMLLRYIDQNKQLSCVISTFGFGYEINSELLRDVANVGGGMYAFIPDASFVGTAFVNAVSNLLTTMARDVVLSIEPQNGAKLDANAGLYGAHQAQPTSWGASVNLRSMQFGQSKDLVFRLVNAPANGVYVSVGVQHDLGSSEQPHKLNVDGFDRTGGADITAQRLRLQFVERVGEAMACAHKSDMAGAAKVVAQLTDLILNSDAANADAVKKGLLVDVTGQVTEAVSKAEYYKKWGRHYLPSLMRAHQLQQCNNFKDPGVQYYGGALFKSERDTVDDIFCKLPPPKPSARRPAAASYSAAPASAGSAAAPAQRAPVSSMRVYHNRSAPCFAGASLARMADGTLRPCAALRKGDAVYTPEAPASAARIVCVVKTLCPTGTTQLVRLSESLLITPYHPVRRNGAWAFPCDLAEAREMSCEAVYSFVLDSHHVMVIGGEECVALGHTFTAPVVAHPYFGSKAILHDLAALPGFDAGLVVFNAPAMLRDERLGVVTSLVPDVVGA